MTFVVKSTAQFLIAHFFEFQNVFLCNSLVAKYACFYHTRMFSTEKPNLQTLFFRDKIQKFSNLFSCSGIVQQKVFFVIPYLKENVRVKVLTLAIVMKPFANRGLFKTSKS